MTTKAQQLILNKKLEISKRQDIINLEYFNFIKKPIDKWTVLELTYLLRDKYKLQTSKSKKQDLWEIIKNHLENKIGNDLDWEISGNELPVIGKNILPDEIMLQILEKMDFTEIRRQCNKSMLFKKLCMDNRNALSEHILKINDFNTKFIKGFQYKILKLIYPYRYIDHKLDIEIGKMIKYEILNKNNIDIPLNLNCDVSKSLYLNILLSIFPSKTLKEFNFSLNDSKYQKWNDLSLQDVNDIKSLLKETGDCYIDILNSDFKPLEKFYYDSNSDSD
jgi:hypothetical protein